MIKKIFLLVIIIVIFYILFGVANLHIVILKCFYPKEYYTEVIKYSKEYNVDENLVFAVIKAESNFDPNAHSRKNAIGLMQLMYETAQDVAKMLELQIDEKKLLEPDVNINLGTKYLSVLIDKYKNIELAVAAYNAGSGNIDNWINNGTIKADGTDIENIPFKETNNYVRKTLRNYRIYNDL